MNTRELMDEEEGLPCDTEWAAVCKYLVGFIENLKVLALSLPI